MIIDVREIILDLNKVGINVLEIFNPLNRSETLTYYSTAEFTPAQNNIIEHSIIGIDITKLIKEDSLQINSGLSSKEHKILSKIESMDITKIRYSKDFSYIWYLSK